MTKERNKFSAHTLVSTSLVVLSSASAPRRECVESVLHVVGLPIRNNMSCIICLPSLMNYLWNLFCTSAPAWAHRQHIINLMQHIISVCFYTARRLSSSPNRKWCLCVRSVILERPATQQRYAVFVHFLISKPTCWCWTCAPCCSFGTRPAHHLWDGASASSIGHSCEFQIFPTN